MWQKSQFHQLEAMHEINNEDASKKKFERWSKGNTGLENYWSFKEVQLWSYIWSRNVNIEQYIYVNVFIIINRTLLFNFKERVAIKGELLMTPYC